jgi:tetratricopeptide (TPR) repeat protein
MAAYGRAQMALGQTEAARQTFQGMTGRAGFDVKRLYRIAQLQIAAGDRKGAEYSLQKAILQQENFMPAQALLAGMEIAAGQYASAEGRIQRLLNGDSTQATGQRLQGEMYMRQGRYDQAVVSYRAALGKADTLDNALGLNRAWQAAGKPQEAAKHLEAWNRNHPGQPAAQQALAEAYLAAGRYQEARLAYQRILATDRNDPVALNNLANILLQLGDGGALAMAERAYQAAPQDANAADTLGLVLLKSGQAERALKYLREARIRAPANAAIREHLAQALEATGRAGEAREEKAAAQSLRGNR